MLDVLPTSAGIPPAAWEHHMEPIATSVASAAKALSLGRSTVYKLIADGKLQTVKIGRRNLIKTASIRLLIDGEA
jgi:excisionase family DNA binding protein